MKKGVFGYQNYNDIYKRYFDNCNAVLIDFTILKEFVLDKKVKK